MSFTTTQYNLNYYNQVGNFTAVTEADPHQLVLMLLDGALGKVALAKGLMIRNDIGKKCEAIGRALLIVGGLRSSLDMAAGGELAVNLDNLYEYIERQLVQANLNNAVAILDEVTSLLGEIKIAWVSIAPVAKPDEKPKLEVTP